MASEAPGGSPGPPLPRASEIIEALESATDALAAGEGGAAPAAAAAAAAVSETIADLERQRSYAHLIGLQRHYRHKSQWSYFLMAMMFGMLAFQSFLLWQVGSGDWTFIQHGEWLLPGLLVQNLAQIAGLCVIVVQALFKDVG
jgi:hypothetical protein